ncbi:hypothetical protein L2Y96_02675 [Luteibacter aegosomaticola]|uniref:hypothetical protein n=1 Tax=Luteibacter aegosomaticola TaxID=2911538 RepID=UPI001FFBDA24|nr:hypothetical protein [Luteibacter aegosomaticola]UPG90696.1 hypothetical protein L2Y96_02675 [Luteibacter aegosomaticola]
MNNQTLKASFVGRVTTIVVTLAVVAATAWMSRMAWYATGEQQYLGSIVASSMSILTVIFISMSISVLSIRLTDDRMQRRVLISSRGVLAKQSLGWDEVLEVSYRQMTFRLSGGGKGAKAFPINIGYFGDRRMVARFIESKVGDKFRR